MANALLGAVTTAALASELASQDAILELAGLQGTPAPLLLTPSRLWTLPRRWTLDSNSPLGRRHRGSPGALLGKADASALPLCSPQWTVGHAVGGRHQNSKCPAKAFVAAQLLAGTPASRRGAPGQD